MYLSLWARCFYYFALFTIFCHYAKENTDKKAYPMSNNIQNYYDANTKRFLRFGHGGKALAIHRAVWAEGVKTRSEAMQYINSLIEEQIRKQSAAQIVDIGCGIGGSMVQLHNKTGASAVGITISPVQSTLGRKLLNSEGLEDVCRIISGNFLTDRIRDASGERFDLAYAVESFLHMERAEAFFQKCSEVIEHQGTLILCDDFLNNNAISGKKDRDLLERVRKGWHAVNLLPIKQVKEKASAFGFTLTEEKDLTPFLELGRPRDKVINMLLHIAPRFLFRFPFWQNLSGGDALQKLLSSGVLSYRFVVFKYQP